MIDSQNRWDLTTGRHVFVYQRGNLFYCATWEDFEKESNQELLAELNYYRIPNTIIFVVEVSASMDVEI